MTRDLLPRHRPPGSGTALQPNLGLVAEDGPELLQARVLTAAGRQEHEDLALVQPQVGADGARAQVRSGSRGPSRPRS